MCSYQLQIIQKVLAEPEVNIVANQAMIFCHQNKVHSAVDFKAIIQQHIKDLKQKEEPGLHLLNPLSGDKMDKNIQPQKSSIQDYQQLVKK